MNNVLCRAQVFQAEAAVRCRLHVDVAAIRLVVSCGRHHNAYLREIWIIDAIHAYTSGQDNRRKHSEIQSLHVTCANLYILSRQQMP